MARSARKWHPRFIRYMDAIVKDPNYQGLPIEKKADGSYAWVTTAKSSIGRARIAWCQRRPKSSGWIPKPPSMRT